MGMKFDAVVARMGNRGKAAAPSVFPQLADQKADKTLVGITNNLLANVYYEWEDEAANHRLIVGYDQGVVAFKAYYTPAGNAYSALYEFDSTRMRKKKR